MSFGAVLPSGNSFETFLWGCAGKGCFGSLGAEIFSCPARSFHGGGARACCGDGAVVCARRQPWRVLARAAFLGAACCTLLRLVLGGFRSMISLTFLGGPARVGGNGLPSITGAGFHSAEALRSSRHKLSKKLALLVSVVL